MAKITEEKRIVMLMQWTGVTKELYEKVRKQVNFEKDVPEGLVIHISMFDKTGLRVVDIWESEENFNNFARDRLMPVTGKLVETKPNIEIYPLYVLFMPGM